MKCPYCGKEMIQGYVWSDPLRTMVWLPEGEEPSFLMDTEKNVAKKNGILWKKNLFGSHSEKRIELHICQNCNVGIAKLDKKEK